MLEKSYQPSQVEGRIYAAWEKANAFAAGRPDLPPAARAKAKPYCIVIPPPNVTGSLHLGHALVNTIQDILIRFERMRGRDVLWQPGTDHAGIATQMVVERKLAADGKPDRRTMGRGAFLKEVWAWKEESGGTIIRQLKRLGASCDWSRERFTLGKDENDQMTKAVIKVFVDLFNEKLIYKDKRLVNWDPKLLTAISDLEVVSTEHRGTFKWSGTDIDKEGAPLPFKAEVLAKALAKDPNGHMYYFRYPLAGEKFSKSDPSTFLVVGTTRPETMLGDTAVAVHPEHPKYGKWIGRKLTLPLVGREIAIIGDDYADPEKGSGAVKITPAHDFNDFEVGKRHGLEQINIFTADAKLNDMVPKSYQGLDRFAARKQVVSDLEEMGYLEKIEPHTHQVPHGDRSGVPVEPWLTDQWYVKADVLAAPVIKAVEDGTTRFIPKQWDKTYFEWMRNIQPWCISRQLWWGHQIPAWYGPDGAVFVAENEAAAMALAGAHYKSGVRPQGSMGSDPILQGSDPMLKRDPDVLDTWFSSALWPFSTLGWPEQTPELDRYYPTAVLVTGFDIIFFWVARMMMMGLHLMEEVPFRTVYIHALVRDQHGAKMSKSKGNVIDPLSLIDQYGADALRFTLVAMAAQGRDLKLSTQRVEGYRNFATKLWNACRFAEMNKCVTVPGFDPKSVEETLNRWIAHETGKAAREIAEAIEAYKFNEAAGAAYRFVWNIFCDWYVELAKPLLQGGDGGAKDETRAMTAWVRDEILKLLHPFTPFVTEELWQVTAEGGPARDGLLALAHWPKHEALDDLEAEAEIGWVIDLVTAIRSLRAEMNITNDIPVVLVGVSPASEARAGRWADIIRRLARLSDISLGDSVPQGAVQLIVRGEVAALPLKGVIDFSAEKTRLDKELAKAEADIKRVDAKLGNEKFVANAPEEIVEEEKEKREAAVARKARILEALERLKNAS